MLGTEGFEMNNSLLWETVPGRMVAASLAFTHLMSVALLPSAVTTKTVSRHCQVSPGGRNHASFKAAALCQSLF